MKEKEGEKEELKTESEKPVEGEMVAQLVPE